MKTILFIDWENFKKKLEKVFEKENISSKPRWYEYNFLGLFDLVLQGIKVDQKRFYVARLSIHPLTEKKSKDLIEEQRLLKTTLENQSFEFIYGGRVRGNVVENKKRGSVNFREKGVDVKIAVDMVGMAYRKELKTVILASSDSDLQPAIKELKGLDVERIYLGFEIGPNKGLSYTTDRTILIRNSEVLEFLPQRLFNG